MKKIFTVILALICTVQLFSQNTLTPEERKSIIDQLKTEILDSIRNSNIVPALSEEEKLKETISGLLK